MPSLSGHRGGVGTLFATLPAHLAIARSQCGCLCVVESIRQYFSGQEVHCQGAVSQEVSTPGSRCEAHQAAAHV